MVRCMTKTSNPHAQNNTCRAASICATRVAYPSYIGREDHLDISGHTCLSNSTPARLCRASLFTPTSWTCWRRSGLVCEDNTPCHEDTSLCELFEGHARRCWHHQFNFAFPTDAGDVSEDAVVMEAWKCSLHCCQSKKKLLSGHNNAV